ncbi:hypothetical protein B0H14DRAFT_2920418 [Mycena olivaceomarginata]|nr:hypothetical protein B0H14DRAFT_2920418 [Mycena olivaceomarginata]
MSTDAGCGAVFEFQHTPESQILPKLSSQSSADLVPLIPLLLSWLLPLPPPAILLLPKFTLRYPTLALRPIARRQRIRCSTTTGCYRASRIKYRALPRRPDADGLDVYSGRDGARLGPRCRYLLEFLDSSQARVPHSKSDELAVRSLELVHAAEEMRPLIPGIATGCWDQLARFPELTIEPIRAVLRRGDDGGWAMNIPNFLLDDCSHRLRMMRSNVCALSLRLNAWKQWIIGPLE